jgi:DNA-binding response OmpR family regulator/DNA-binding CsgD family transcriptional regulator
MEHEYHILIADDDAEKLRILTGYLIEWCPDCRLMIATNGKAALEIASRDKPDLILLDWHMPYMSGLEVMKNLKAGDETSNIPVIIVTGAYNDPEKLKEALDSGAGDFLRKPYSRVELIARINSQIRNIHLLKQIIEHQEIIKRQMTELAEKEKLILKEEVQHHQKQLTINAVNFLKLGQLVESLGNEVNSLKPYTNDEGKKIIKSIIARLSLKSSESMWSEFELCFGKVHADFYPKLVEKLPNLTVREKRLCAFLKMNMSNKEIADITLLSNNAIDVAKHRLRKKAGCEKEDDLVNFILNL